VNTVLEEGFPESLLHLSLHPPRYAASLGTDQPHNLINVCDYSLYDYRRFFRFYILEQFGKRRSASIFITLFPVESPFRPAEVLLPIAATV
jgi:hypothetical protein